MSKYTKIAAQIKGNDKQMNSNGEKEVKLVEKVSRNKESAKVHK